MKIYLDNCSWQRPLDSKTQVRPGEPPYSAEKVYLVMVDAGVVK